MTKIIGNTKFKRMISYSLELEQQQEKAILLKKKWMQFLPLILFV